MSSEKSWHTGGCHCGAVRFSALLPKDIIIHECNCSICRLTGYQGVFVTKDAFRLEKGEEALTSYRFNTGVANHLFCRHCGIKSFYVPRSHPEGYSVHFPCLDTPDAFTVSHRSFDGVHWEENIAALRGE